ncbi:hypothetical protein O3P69_006821 [Scylla paramamosain]|uniref:Alpha-carbonic anhydrase domain-containing protein n=1 Tax=Scylla paramamosain TaxID=85552 RepID=A0AAW0U162_SCYPA
MVPPRKVTLVVLVICLTLTSADPDPDENTTFDWSSWWSYDGISGPGFWGIINRRWRLCSDGKRQSPVDLVTSSIVFDHTLPQLTLSSHKVSDGPLHYAHTLAHAVLRWSNAARSTHTVGSEHSIQGQMFPAEYSAEHYFVHSPPPPPPHCHNQPLNARHHYPLATHDPPTDPLHWSHEALSAQQALIRSR